MARNYSSIAPIKTLGVNLPEDPTSPLFNVITLNDKEGLPTPPFVLVVDPDTSNEEAVLCDSDAGGSSYNVTRSIETNASPKPHTGGTSTARHMIVGTDLQIVNDHMSDTSTHGVDEIVGRTEPQVLTGKTISGASNTLTNIAQSSVTNLSSDLAAKASSADLTAHTGASTSVHGIADSSKLARVASASAGRTIFVQSAQPTALAVGDIWFQVTGL